MNFLKNKKCKLQYFLLLLSLFIIPLNAYAYSNYIIPGGETIGIEVNSKGVLVVGFYKVQNEYIGKDAGFLVGDKIISINNQKITTIDEMVNIVNKEATNKKLEVTIERNSKTSTLPLDLVCDSESVCKTGLYVKDEITGIGTLTYIDPDTKIFGALGHEILEKTTGERFEIKDGKIFKADVTSTTRSSNGTPGGLQPAREAVQLGAGVLRAVRGRKIQHKRRRELRIFAGAQRSRPVRHAILLGVYGRGDLPGRLEIYPAV